MCRCGLKSFASSIIFFITLMKTGQNQFHTVTRYLLSTIRNLEPTAIHNSGSVQVKIECCEGMSVERVIIEFLTVDQIPPIDINCQMQAAYGDKCVEVSAVDNGYGNLGKKWGKLLV